MFSPCCSTEMKSNITHHQKKKKKKVAAFMLPKLYRLFGAINKDGYNN